MNQPRSKSNLYKRTKSRSWPKVWWTRWATRKISLRLTKILPAFNLRQRTFKAIKIRTKKHLPLYQLNSKSKTSLIMRRRRNQNSLSKWRFQSRTLMRSPSSSSHPENSTSSTGRRWNVRDRCLSLVSSPIRCLRQRMKIARADTTPLSRITRWAKSMATRARTMEISNSSQIKRSVQMKSISAAEVRRVSR